MSTGNSEKKVPIAEEQSDIFRERLDGFDKSVSELREKVDRLVGCEPPGEAKNKNNEKNPEDTVKGLFDRDLKRLADLNSILSSQVNRLGEYTG